MTFKDLEESFPSHGQITRLLGELAESVPSRDAIARAAGVAVRSPLHEIAAALSIFAGGFLLGMATVMLLAPESRGEVRERLSRQASQLGNQGAELAEGLIGSGESAREPRATGAMARP
jgi:hypothetical protein